MKKEWKLKQYIFPLLLPFFIYIIFHLKGHVHSTPINADFWIIIAMGMSIGVAICRFFEWLNKKGKK